MVVGARSMRAFVLAFALVLTACGPTGPAGGQITAQNAPDSIPAARKVVTIAFAREPGGVEIFAGTATTGRNSIAPILHNQLAYEGEYEKWVPQLATELPSLEKGTWRINADGTMDMTWTVRPNIRWHDGIPFSTDDIVFAFNVRKDPELAVNRATTGRPELMESASAPDTQTLVVHWSQVFVDADRGRALEPMPRHILQDLYTRDKQTFANSAYWHADFIGLGAYRMATWERGSHVEMTRFDDYYLGRPPLDAIIGRFISDPNTVVAGLLAGTIDVATDQSDVGTDPALEVRRRWEGTGNQVRFDPNGGVMALEIQYRDEFARPRNGFTNRPVRQAFYQALDRPLLADVVTEGLSPVADSWYPPIHPQRRELESAIPQFPYDPARALQLLADVGWVRGPDGLLVHQQTGERFETELWSTASYGDPLTRANAIIDYWKAIGAPVAPYAVPPAVDSDRERMAKRPGPLTVGAQGKTYEETRLHSKFVPVESTRWTGINRGAYANPKADAILDRLTATVAPRDRIQLHRELLQEQMGDLAVMPLWWNMVPTLTARGVKGVRLVPTAATLNSFEWDRD